MPDESVAFIDDYVEEREETPQNITDQFSEQELDEIAELISREFEIDESNFAPRKRLIEEIYALALQALDVKNYPWEGASNIKYPVITKAALSFSALASPAIIKDSDVVKGAVIGNDDGDEAIKGPDGKPLIDPDSGKPKRKNAGLKQKKADRVSKFMSHQVLNDIDGWEDEMDKILLINPIIGCTFKKVYYDPMQRKNVSRLVLPQYLIINIDAQSVESASRASELIEMYPNEIESYIRAGIFRNFDYNQSTETLRDNYNEAEEQGTSNASDSTIPHVFIEQHRYLDLDNDGYEEPYIVWLHKQTNKVVRILPRFEEEEDVLYDGEKVIKIFPENQYIKYPFIPDPEGSPYDIGFGHLIRHLNDAVNATTNQMIDQGHRYTMGGGFIGSGLRMKSGTLRFKPGEYKRVQSQGVAIRDNVVNLPMPEPSTVLMALMESLLNAAEDIAAMSRIMAGDIPANTPATTALAAIDQGLQPFKAIFKRMHRALKKEYGRLFDLNQKHLTQEEYMRVLDDPAADVGADFSKTDIDVIPVSDPESLTSTQSFVKAQFFMSFLDDPLFDGVELRKRILEAMRVQDIDELVKVPKQQGPDPLVQAQMMALESQVVAQKDESKNKAREQNRKDMEFGLKLEESIAGMKKTLADATKSLAQAESEEEGVQLEQYKAQLETLTQLKERLNSGNNSRVVDTMA